MPMNHLLFLLLWMTAPIPTHPQLFQATVTPICGPSDTVASTCGLSLTIMTDLNELFSNASEMITGITYNKTAYALIPSVNVSVQRLESVVVIPIKFLRTLHNTYESFQPDMACMLSRNLGICNGRPGGFTLCCLGGLRGWGQHCLTIDEGAEYAAFSLGSPLIIQRVAINVTAGPFSVSTVLDSTNRSFGTPQIQVTLDPGFVQPPGDAQNVVEENFLVRDMRADAASFGDWFLMPNAVASIVGQTEVDWRWSVGCGQAVQSATATHTDAAHITDQFFPFLAAGLTAFTNLSASLGPPDVLLNTSARGSLTLPYRDKDSSHVTIIVNSVIIE